MEFENKKQLIVILIFAAVLRFGVTFVFFRDYVPTDDAADWHLAAQNLLAGDGLIYSKGLKAYRTPVPALYFAAIYSIFGVSTRAVQLANVFLGIVTVLLIYDFARRSFGPKPAVWAAVFVSCHPLLLLYTGQLLSETPVIMLLSLALWLVWLLRGRPALWQAPVGIVLGLAVLTRESMLPSAFLIALWSIVNSNRTEWLGRLVASTIILMFLVFTLAPWTVRNYRIFGKFVPLTSKGGLSLWIANNPLADGTGMEKVMKTPELSNLPEGERGFIYQELAMRFIAENPLKFCKLALRRIMYFWHLEYHGEGLKELLFLTIYWPMLFLAGIGAWVGWRSNRHVTLLLLILPVSLTLVHMVFLPVGRYRLPADLIMCIFGAFGAYWILTEFVKSRFCQKDACIIETS